MPRLETDGMYINRMKDEFFKHNKNVTDASTLGKDDPNKYLRNRLENAFITGCQTVFKWFKPQIERLVEDTYKLGKLVKDKQQMIEALDGDILLAHVQLDEIKNCIEGGMVEADYSEVFDAIIKICDDRPTPNRSVELLPLLEDVRIWLANGNAVLALSGIGTAVDFLKDLKASDGTQT